MPTIFAHPAVPLAIHFGLGRRVISQRLLIAGMAVSILPDLDAIGFWLGVPYADELGHRGASHSLAAAAAFAFVVSMMYRKLHATFARAFVFLFVCGASHGLLDAFTDGGLGIATLWPWSASVTLRRFRLSKCPRSNPRGSSRDAASRSSPRN